MPEEIIDVKARADLAAHKAVCDVIREQQIEAAKHNREEHHEMLVTIKEIGDLLSKYDKHAILRWLLFGGAILATLLTGVVDHWFVNTPPPG